MSFNSSGSSKYLGSLSANIPNKESLGESDSDDLPDIKISSTRSMKTSSYRGHDISSSSEEEEINAFVPLKDRIQCSLIPNENVKFSPIHNSSNKYQETPPADRNIKIYDCITVDDDSNESELCNHVLQQKSFKGEISNNKYSPGTSDLNSNNFSSHTRTVESISKHVRTAEEIQERKRHAQEKLLERNSHKQEKIKARDEKQALKAHEALVKKIEKERKKQYGEFKDSAAYMTVIMDTHLVNDMGLGASVFKACESLGIQCITECQEVPFTVTWKREVTNAVEDGGKVKAQTVDVVEDCVLVVIPIDDFMQLVHNGQQKTFAEQNQEIKKLPEFIRTLKNHFVGKEIFVVVLGMETYFRGQKNKMQRMHKEAVRNNDKSATGKVRRKKGETNMEITRINVEEATTEAYLHTGCMVQMCDTSEQFAELLRSYSKAVTEKPSKKDRLNSVFSFTEEGNSGVKVDKSGHGLLKVWKHQLMQFKNISPEIAAAIVAEYPSPRLLIEKYRSCQSEKEAVSVLENITIRRGAGVLETTRRIGKEMSRRIYSFVMSNDPDNMIL